MRATMSKKKERPIRRNPSLPARRRPRRSNESHSDGINPDTYRMSDTPMTTNADRTSPSLLLLKPTKFALAIGVAGIVLLVAMLTALVVNFQSFTMLGQIWIGVGVLVVSISLVDHFQRRYEVTTDAIRVRRLFLWRQYELPQRIDVVSSKNGQVLVRSEDGRLILRIPREFSQRGQLVIRLREFLRR